MTIEGALDVAVSTTDGGTPRVEFAFTVTNEGGEAVDLHFSDAAKAEFVVQDESREVWRFTEGRVFAQMLSTDRLEPGESVTYDGEWDGASQGAYTVIAELQAREATCTARAEFEVSA
ncbi:BsuPI-related putative proteinase inhibitor [Natrarchaeobaculum sulfurireducens]|uniref:Intracellular proteinase inhibitor BsuPI domain-containing protein n=1 Tax=Natrarchaeobaculum sulfurireducens TaxID=2044521 RepID=A0A346PFD9_9EURY|nr:BsuPI-related putative proteinase inhibitor [Natrarchaeobaculum sulfurireducens]AXR78234.1 hypothetical protein AArc1_1913 [Natrarchaeobaculum sulfurireducens]AXR81727.1 hypothetical protein AArcMg_1717 [Natrarchaeobaculum sulfurireducens]